MQRDPMKDILASAGAMFRDEMRQVDIEEFFDDRGITLAEGNSKATYASNTLASLSQDQASSLILELKWSQLFGQVCSVSRVYRV